MITTNRFLHSHQRPILSTLSTLHLSEAQDENIAKLWGAFPSDHKPGFTEIMGVRIGIWNRLNEQYITHLQRDAWKNSALVEVNNNIWGGPHNISHRTKLFLNKMESFFFGEKPCDVVCLQEVSDNVLERLQELFAFSDILISHENGGRNNHVVTLVNPSSSLSIQNTASRVLFHRHYYPGGDKTKPRQNAPDIWRPSMDTTLSLQTPMGSNHKLRIFNLHISVAGEPDEIRLERMTEVMNNIKALAHPDENIVICGDSNVPLHLRAQVADLQQKYIELLTTPGQVDNYKLVAEAIDMIAFCPRYPQDKHWVIPNPIRDSWDPETREIYRKTLDPLIQIAQTPLQHLPLTPIT